MKNGWGLHRGVIVLTLVAGAFSASAQFSAPGAGVVQAGSAASIPQAQLLQPEALHQLLLAPGSDKPLVLQVGSHILFAEAHIPGSEYMGPGSRPQGLELLQTRLMPLARKTLIVLYCGCCPWGRCPNVEPAFAKVREMGFTNVKVLYLADNFGTDWVSKEYLVEKGR